MSDSTPQTGPVEFIGFWYRTGAALWDLLILAALTGALAAVLVGDQMNSEHGGRMAALLLVLMATAYTLCFWILTGTSPGKWLCSCRIVDAASGAKPRPWQFFLRFACYLLVPGFLWMIWNRRRRALHDLLSRTAVIGDASLRGPDEVERTEARFSIEDVPWQAGR